MDEASCGLYPRCDSRQTSLNDLWLIAPLHRIVSFIGIGVLMLLCSLTYHRFKQFILGLPDGDNSPRSRRRSPPGGCPASRGTRGLDSCPAWQPIMTASPVSQVAQEGAAGP